MNKDRFKKYVTEWADRIGVSDKITSIHLRKMKTKIASCSSKGRLTFDISILEKAKKEIDKIIVHELLHLRYPNHGKMFQLMLKNYLKQSSNKF